MKWKRWRLSPWMLLLLAAGLLLSMADWRVYGQEGLTMTAIERSVTPGSVTVEILNTTEERFWNYGDYSQDGCRLQRRLWGLWLPMRREARPEGTVCAALPVFVYEQGAPQRFTFRWADHFLMPFSKLEPGRYRLILEFYREGGKDAAVPLAAEFEVR